MKSIAAALAALMLAATFAAAATAIDLSTWTCRKFLTASKDDTASSWPGSMAITNRRTSRR